MTAIGKLHVTLLADASDCIGRPVAAFIILPATRSEHEQYDQRCQQFASRLCFPQQGMQRSADTIPGYCVEMQRCRLRPQPRLLVP